MFTPQGPEGQNTQATKAEQLTTYSPETLAEYTSYKESIQVIIDLLNHKEINLTILNDSQLQTVATIANLTLNRKEGTVYIHNGNDNANANEALPILTALHSAKSIETFLANKTRLSHVEEEKAEIARIDLLKQELRAAKVQNEIDSEIVRGGIHTSALQALRIAFQPSIYIAGAGAAIAVTGAVGSGLAYGGLEIGKYFEVQQMQRTEAIATAKLEVKNQRDINKTRTQAEQTKLMINAEASRIGLMTQQFKAQTEAAKERKEALGK
jgi:hypothetical protein